MKKIKIVNLRQKIKFKNLKYRQILKIKNSVKGNNKGIKVRIIPEVKFQFIKIMKKKNKKLLIFK